MKTFSFLFAVASVVAATAATEAQTPTAAPAIASPAPSATAAAPLVIDSAAPKSIDPTSAPGPDTVDPNATDDPTPKETPIPESVLDSGSPAVRARVRSLIAQMQSGSYDNARLTAGLKARLTVKKRASIAKDLAPLGRPSLVIFASVVSGNMASGVFKAYVYRITWPTAKTRLSFTLDPSGRVDGFYFNLKKDPKPSQ